MKKLLIFCFLTIPLCLQAESSQTASDDFFLPLEKEGDYRKLQHHDLFFVSQDARASWAEAGFDYRSKSGDAGLSRLEEWGVPFVNENLSTSETDEWNFSLRRFSLNSGALPLAATIGTHPLAATAWTHSPTTQQSNLLEPKISFRRYGDTTFFAELGTSPLNASLHPLPTGSLAVTQYEQDGYWRISSFSESKKESMLSYIGITDPYTGEKFGRVLETGLQTEGFLDLGDQWGFFGQGKIAWLLGKEVEDNQHYALNFNFSRNLGFSTFHYFSIGPAFFSDFYHENLSQFTRGHGGYFSPEYLFQSGVAVNFLTKEMLNFISRGYVFAGVQTNAQQGSPYFPMNDDGRHYARDTNTSFTFSLNLENTFRLNDQWQMGNFFCYNKSANYHEISSQFFLRFLFEMR